MENNQLTHHGIKGQKWGVRRSSEQLARARGVSPQTRVIKKKPGFSLFGRKKTVTRTVPVRDDAHDDYKRTHRVKLSTMSDADLQKSVSRLQMEKSYAQLTQKQKSAGRQFVEGVLTDAAKRSATDFVARVMTNQLEKLLTKK